MTKKKISLSELASVVGGELVGTDDPLISGVMLDSREVIPGTVFVAVPGSSLPGEQFVAEARGRGAIAAVVSDKSVLNGFSGIVVEDPRLAASKAAACLAGYPSRRLQLVGVTGTNGKSTITWLLFHLFRQAGLKAARIGTLGLESTSVISELPLTTPDAVFLQNSLARFLAEGVTHCVMEVSSHALEQKRVEDLEFDAALFTNLSHDHLDYHGDMKNYFRSKLRLFDLLSRSSKSSRAAVVNSDDPYGKLLREKFSDLKLRDLSFSHGLGTAVSILAFDENRDGSRIRLGFDNTEHSMQSSLIGKHNSENIAASFGAWIGLGLNPELFMRLLPQVPQVPGRLERIVAGPSQAFSVYIDYAHSPDALSRVLQALKPSTSGRLTVVFGCGGDRDRAKRRVMGKVAAGLADRVIVTSDNPRGEEPEAIIAEILEGVAGKSATAITDRRAAITEAIFHSLPGDTVLIAGKGHENYQVIGKQRFPFSDQKEALRVLAGLFPSS